MHPTTRYNSLLTSLNFPGGSQQNIWEGQYHCDNVPPASHADSKLFPGTIMFDYIETGRITVSIYTDTKSAGYAFSTIFTYRVDDILDQVHAGNPSPQRPERSIPRHQVLDTDPCTVAFFSGSEWKAPYPRDNKSWGCLPRRSSARSTLLSASPLYPLVWWPSRDQIQGATRIGIRCLRYRQAETLQKLWRKILFFAWEQCFSVLVNSFEFWVFVIIY